MHHDITEQHAVSMNAVEGTAEVVSSTVAHAHSPMEQFKIKKIFDIILPNGVDVSFTNSTLLMLLVTIGLCLFFEVATRRKSFMPSKMQSFCEIIYHNIITMLKASAGSGGSKFFPLIFSMFIFVLLCNLAGMVPFSFTVTSHIIVTFAMAMVVFAAVVVTSIIKLKHRFFTIFVPSGTPMIMVPLMFIIEVFAYFAKPISLSVRLAANMLAGHTMLKIIAGFVFPLGIVGGWLPVLFLSVLTGFELFVAILQAYIFALLSCIYLGQALEDAH